MPELRDGKPYLSHADRTAAEPRDPYLHQVALARIEQISDTVRLLRLEINDRRGTLKFKPGQWLDVHVPDPIIQKPGGFTVTSAPSSAEPSNERVPFLELAVQYSPKNPPAAWLWQRPENILGKRLDVRIGGSFVWPPAHRSNNERLVRVPKQVIMVAGGVGINPLMSMLSHISIMHRDRWPIPVTLLYASKASASPESMLFLPRLLSLAPPLRLELFLGTTGNGVLPASLLSRVPVHSRRVELDDIGRAAQLANPEGVEDACFYVCGPQKMTDSFVEGIKGLKGVAAEDVMCEKWW